MAHSGSRSSQRAEVAPPRDSSSRSKRNGYVLLAVSGVVLATAFGGLAQLSSSSTNTASGDFPGGNANSASGPQLIPGNPVPGTTTVNGTAQPDPATSPTAVVSVGPDGKPVVTILPAAGVRSEAGRAGAGDADSSGDVHSAGDADPAVEPGDAFGSREGRPAADVLAFQAAVIHAAVEFAVDAAQFGVVHAA